MVSVRTGVLRLVCWAGMASMACAPSVRDAFMADAFSSGYGYTVRYERGRELLPPTWGLENFRREHGELVHKSQEGYVSTFEFDDNGDGTVDTRFQAYTYALRYEHRKNAGMIWLRNIPISPRLADKDLRILVQTLVNEMAGASYETAQIPDVERAIVVEKRQAATIVEEEPVTVAGQPGYLATIDFANIDQLRLTPDARARRVQIVLLHAPATEDTDPPPEYHGEQVHGARPGRRYPVLVAAGYSNLPADFDSGLADFHQLLGRIAIAGKTGFAIPSPVQQAPSTPSAPAPQPADPPAPSQAAQ